MEGGKWEIGNCQIFESAVNFGDYQVERKLAFSLNYYCYTQKSKLTVRFCYDLFVFDGAIHEPREQLTWGEEV